jgi:chromosome segregation ATPase
MADVDPNIVADAGVQDLQGAINKLSALKTGPKADIPAIDRRIEALQQKQADLRSQALRTVEDSDANKQAIAVLNQAAAALKSEAADIKDLATALSTAAKVVSAAAALASALAPFA